MDEEWKDIKGFEGKYLISNFGNVKSLNYRNHGYAKNLTPKKNNDGYLWVELWNCGKKRNCLIHRLVAASFISNIGNLPEVNHKDENPANNHVDNLEWCDRLYNVRYSISKRKGRKIKRERNFKPSEKYRKHDKILNMFDKDGNLIKTFPSLKQCCEDNGYNSWGIIECCYGNRKTAYGYKWKFAE